MDRGGPRCKRETVWVHARKVLSSYSKKERVSDYWHPSNWTHSQGHPRPFRAASSTTAPSSFSSGATKRTGHTSLCAWVTHRFCTNFSHITVSKTRQSLLFSRKIIVAAMTKHTGRTSLCAWVTHRFCANFSHITVSKTRQPLLFSRKIIVAKTMRQLRRPAWVKFVMLTSRVLQAPSAHPAPALRWMR